MIGDTLDFILSERRDEDAATAFFKQAINNNGLPDKVVMDKSGANYAGLANINLLLILAGFATLIDHPSAKIYLFPVSERSLLQQWLANNG
jgi:putative transposase